MKALTLATLAILGMFLMSSCVVWKFDTLLTERNRDDVPDISGRYVDSKNQTITITKTQFSNTFVLQPPSGQAQVRMTMENLSPNRFLVQASMGTVEPGMPSYFFSVAEVTGNKITAYFFVNQEAKVRELAAKHKVKVELVGITKTAAGSPPPDPKTAPPDVNLDILTAYDSVDDLIAFVNELFTVEGSQKVTITKR
jgi:hypothetical protein